MPIEGSVIDLRSPYSQQLILFLSWLVRRLTLLEVSCLSPSVFSTQAQELLPNLERGVGRGI